MEKHYCSFPLKTIVDNQKITKVVIEDYDKVYYKLLDKIYNLYLLVDSLKKQTPVDFEDGKLSRGYKGVGVSEPCGDDKFDETIGHEIAFKKAKLSANLKKLRKLRQIAKRIIKMNDLLLKESFKLESYIDKDLTSLRKFNPDYLKGIEDEI